METKIYLVRHARRYQSWEGIDKYGYDDPSLPLSDQGNEDAKELANIYDFSSIDKIVCSSAVRCISTIKYIAVKYNLPIILDDRLLERRRGNTQMPVDEFLVKQFEDFEFVDGTAESMINKQRNMIGAINDVLKDNVGKNVIVSTHGIAIASLFAKLMNNFGYVDIKKFHMPDMWILTFDGESIDCIKNIEHIELNLEK